MSDTFLLNDGEQVFIRTVTYHYVGRIEYPSSDDGFALRQDYIMLADASWVADSGRFFDALRSGTLSEVEPMPHGVLVARASIVDISPWPHKLPDQQI